MAIEWMDDSAPSGGIQWLDEPAKSFLDSANDLVGGAVRGAGSIGATILTPVDAAARAFGIENEFIGRRDRREAMDEGLRNLGIDTNSGEFQAGKIGTEIAGTLGAGGALANLLKLSPALSAAAPKLISSIESGGFSLGSPAAQTFLGRVGNLGVRTLGGATVGGVSAGMVNPESAGTGAMIGGALPGALKAAGGLGQGAGYVAKKVIGGMTGVGDEALSTAIKAGREGNRTFLDNMRGKVDMTDVLDDARVGLQNIAKARGSAYEKGMSGVAADNAILDMAPILKTADDAIGDTMFKGVVVKENAAKSAQKVKDVIDDWAGRDPAQFHTAEGLDKLKQKVGDILEAEPHGTPGWRVANNAFQSIKKQITDQAPEYAKVMKDYSEASELIKEINRSLSIGPKGKSAADTAMRKLQSLMRNNVNTSYGNRLNLARELESQGGKDILPAVAGQAMNDLMPRGLARLGQAGLGMTALFNPGLLALAPLTSPRLVGEALYGAGRVAGGSRNALVDLLAKSLPPQTLAALARPTNFRTVAPAIALGTRE